MVDIKNQVWVSEKFYQQHLSGIKGQVEKLKQLVRENSQKKVPCEQKIRKKHINSQLGKF